MPKVKIEIGSGWSKWGPFCETIKVFVDGELLTIGNYGGEPEDNLRCRDYRWVEIMVADVAKKLGAQVEEKEFEFQDNFDGYEDWQYKANES
jgi:hypothetical protein